MTTDNTATAIITSGVSATAIVFFRDAVSNMLPYLICAIPLIALDLDFGIKAAKHRKERITFSKGLRGTFGKIMEYLAWACFAATAALAFDKNWIEWIVLGAVFINELASVIGNYAETKNVEISWAYLWNKLLHLGGQKAGLDTTEIDVGELVKPKQPRNEKGQFVKKEE